MDTQDQPEYQQTYYSEQGQYDTQQPAPRMAPQPLSQTLRPRKRLSRRNLLIRIAAIVIPILLVIGGYEAYQSYQLQHNPAAASKAQTSEVLAALSKVMEVPNDPNPVVATVVDKSKLQSQPFFQNAVNGDFVVIFPSAMEAVLYRPSTHQVINIAPLSVQQPSVTAPTTGTTVATTSAKTTSKTSSK